MRIINARPHSTSHFVAITQPIRIYIANFTRRIHFFVECNFCHLQRPWVIPDILQPRHFASADKLSEFFFSSKEIFPRNVNWVLKTKITECSLWIQWDRVDFEGNRSFQVLSIEGEDTFGFESLECSISISSENVCTVDGNLTAHNCNIHRYNFLKDKRLCRLLGHWQKTLLSILCIFCIAFDSLFPLCFANSITKNSHQVGI